MECREDDFQRRLVLELRVWVDGHAAAIVADQDAVAGEQLEMDRVGMARDRLVHGVVEDLGHEMVHGTFIGAADIHARALADGLEPLQHLDVACRVRIVLGRGLLLPAARSFEQIAAFGHESCFFPWPREGIA